MTGDELRSVLHSLKSGHLDVTIKDGNGDHFDIDNVQLDGDNEGQPVISITFIP